MKKAVKQKAQMPEKIVVDHSHVDADSLKEKAAKMMEDAALGEMIRDAIKSQEKKTEGPSSLDDLRKIRQQRHEEEMNGETE